MRCVQRFTTLSNRVPRYRRRVAFYDDDMCPWIFWLPSTSTLKTPNVFSKRFDPNKLNTCDMYISSHVTCMYVRARRCSCIFFRAFSFSPHRFRGSRVGVASPSKSHVEPLGQGVHSSTWPNPFLLPNVPATILKKGWVLIILVIGCRHKNFKIQNSGSDQCNIQRDPSMSVHRMIGIGSCTTSTNQHVVQ